MVPVTVMDLRKGDTFRFAESGGVYTLADRYGAGVRELVVLDLVEISTVTVPCSLAVYAEAMYRVVNVPCLVHKGTVSMMWNVASGGTPRAVLCNDCDEKVTAEVMARMAEEKKHE